MENKQVIQITVDDNNNVTGYSIGGYIPDGITVDFIPEEITNGFDAGKYKYIDGEFVYNTGYVKTETQEQNAGQPTNADLQAEITALKEQNTLLESCVMQLADTVYAV